MDGVASGWLGSVQNRSNVSTFLGGKSNVWLGMLMSLDVGPCVWSWESDMWMLSDVDINEVFHVSSFQIIVFN